MLPAIVIVMLLLFQAMVIGHDYLLVVNAAREAARAATVDTSDQDAIAAVHASLPDAQVTIVRERGIGRPLHAHVKWHAPTSLPIVGALLPDPWLEFTVTMRTER